MKITHAMASRHASRRRSRAPQTNTSSIQSSEGWCSMGL